MIDFQNVSKRFGTQDILVNASFRINTGEHAGIVGPNGTGKSTIAAIVAGECGTDGGTVILPAGATIGFLHQQVSELHSQTPLLLFAEGGAPALQSIEAEIRTAENMLASTSDIDRPAVLHKLGELQTAFEHAGGYDLRHRTEAALSGLGFPPDDLNRPVGEFSGGWQMRAALTRSLIAHPDILLLDEPSNYLDLPAVEWLQRFLRDYKGTLVLISHDRYLLNSLTSVTIEVANGATERYAGNYDHYLRERQSRYETRINAQKNYERKVEKAEKFVERFRYKATKSAQVKSRIKMIERMETIDTPMQISARGTIRIPPPSRSGQEVVRLDEAGLSYDGKRWILKNVDLRIDRGEKLALVGHNGLGKTTLLRMLSGLLPLSAGKRKLGHNVVLGYQSQEFADTMDPNRTVFDTLKSIAQGEREQNIRGLLGGFGFSGSAVEKRVSVLSGGEKVRLAFARLLANPPNFLLLDEPTTHLDIAARETLEEALIAYQGTLCIVSHDVTFVEKVAAGLLVMQPPGVQRFYGTYSDYRSSMAGTGSSSLQKQKATSSGASGTASVEGALTDKKELRRQRAQERQALATKTQELKRTITRSEKQIDIFEQEQARILKILAGPPTSVDFAETNRRLQIIQSEIEEYTRRWESASEELEALSE